MTRVVALVGNPNSGKTLLFNQLTGESGRVGNWPGVTVSQKIGQLADEWATVVDLPGCYQLLSLTDTLAEDERITARFLQDTPPDIIVNVIDISQLERHLYLTCQLMERGIPLVLVLNKVDKITANLTADALAGFSECVGCPVVAIQANQPESVQQVLPALQAACVPALPPIPAAWHAVAESLQACFAGDTHRVRQALEFPAMQSEAVQARIQPPPATDWPYDIALADVRYQQIHRWCKHLSLDPVVSSMTQRLDRLFLHRLAALPCFVLIMSVLFLLTVQGGGIVGQWFDILANQWLIDQQLLPWLTQPWLQAFLAQGAAKGVVTTLTFVPALFALFFCLHALEESGYMARAAFVMDRLMQCVSLPGRSFIAMMVGFGCNVPALMATRVLGGWRERVLTACMVPFMSCSARLAVFVVFAQVFFPQCAFLVVLGLYLLGLIAAIITGLVARLGWLAEPATELVMELPAYQWPKWSQVRQRTKRSVCRFVLRAGSVIVPLAMVLAGLSHLGATGEYVTVLQASVLAKIAQYLTGFFHPIGVSPDNWQAVVALVSGVWAKEVMLGVFAVLYQVPHPEVTQTVWQALAAVPQQALSWQGGDLAIRQGLLTHFHSSGEALAYLVFVTLYFPCMATLATFKRELGGRLAWMAAAWSFVLAYGLAALTASSVWHLCIGLLAALFGLSLAARWRERVA